MRLTDDSWSAGKNALSATFFQDGGASGLALPVCDDAIGLYANGGRCGGGMGVVRSGGEMGISFL